MRKLSIIFLLLFTTPVPALPQQYHGKPVMYPIKDTLPIQGYTPKINKWSQPAHPFGYGTATKKYELDTKHYFESLLFAAPRRDYSKRIPASRFYHGPVRWSLPDLQESLALKKLEGDDWAIAAGFHEVANFKRAVGENQAAILYYDSAQQLFMKLGDTSNAACSMAWKGHAYFNTGNYEKAYKTGQAALELTKKTDTLGQILSLAHLANLFLGTGLPDITIQFFHRILGYYPELMNQKLTRCNHLTWALERGGEAFVQLNILDSAQQIAQVMKVPFPDQDVTNHLFYGHLYIALRQYDNALLHFRKGYQLAKRSAQLISVANHAEALGRTYLEKKNFSQALYYSREALNVAMQIHALLEMKNAAGTLAEIYEQTGDYSNAYHYSKLSKSFNDSLAPETYKRKLSLLQVQNELEIRQQEAQILSRENQLKVQQLNNLSLWRKILVGATVVGCFLGLVAWRNTYLKRKNESHRRLIAEQELHLQKVSDETMRTGLERHAAELVGSPGTELEFAL